MTKLSLAQTKKTENCLKQSKVKPYSLKTYTTIRKKYWAIMTKASKLMLLKIKS